MVVYHFDGVHFDGLVTSTECHFDGKFKLVTSTENHFDGKVKPGTWTENHFDGLMLQLRPLRRKLSLRRNFKDFFYGKFGRFLSKAYSRV